MVKDMNLEFDGRKNSMVEWQMSFPAFVRSFYDHIYENSHIPNQQQLFDYYLDNNEGNKTIDGLTSEQFKGLRSRIYRALPSYVRDIHFAKMVDKGTNFNVATSIDLDMNQGVDILIQENQFKYSINLYVDTQRSKVARYKKEDRHDKDSDYIDIEFPISFEKAKGVGDFYLYGEGQLVKLLNVMLNSQHEMVVH